MVNLRLAIPSITNILNNYGSKRCNLASFKREYSVFPPHYIKPIYRKDEQEALFKSEESLKIAHQQVKPAQVTDTCSDFYDARVLKFINIIMRHGNKRLATTLVTKAFEGVKRIQLQRYHKAQTKEEKDNIELNPYRIFHNAVDNCTPVLHLVMTRKGGIKYQVPVPISPIRAQHSAMNWLIAAANEKEDNQRIYDTLAKELVSASLNQGRAVKWKEELHKKCQDNRAYAHFRWI